jgi:hypothetical protein
MARMKSSREGAGPCAPEGFRHDDGVQTAFQRDESVAIRRSVRAKVGDERILQIVRRRHDLAVDEAAGQISPEFFELSRSKSSMISDPTKLTLATGTFHPADRASRMKAPQGP